MEYYGQILGHCHQIRELQFQYTKVTDGVYTRALAGYHILTADALIRHWGGGFPSYSTTMPPHPLTYKLKPTSRMGQTWQASKWWQAVRYGPLPIGSGGDPAQVGYISGHGCCRPVGYYNEFLPFATNPGRDMGGQGALSVKRGSKGSIWTIGGGGSRR